MSNTTQKQPNCFDCVHRNIMETSHEWIECKCKCDSTWQNPFFPHCTNYEEDRKENEDE